MVAQPLSSLQLELLKIYSFNPSEDELLAVRQLLARFFSDKMLGQIGKSVENNHITEADLEKWLNDDH